jgi:hypothetical protein
MEFMNVFITSSKRVPKVSQRNPKGTKREPKGAKMEPRGAKSEALAILLNHLQYYYFALSWLAPFVVLDPILGCRVLQQVEYYIVF